MKGKTLSAILMMLVLLVACFVSVPVFSGEHPWDADGGGGEDEGKVFAPRNEQPPTDTVIVNLDPVEPDPTMGSIWYIDIMVSVAIWYTTEIAGAGFWSTRTSVVR
ncbi:MAG: hypothetical protein KKA42_14965 [candidate division Zixibacteria bacterium]|nr:hypothetical protein [candidate division Zixibacteria bacterium]